MREALLSAHTPVAEGSRLLAVAGSLLVFLLCVRLGWVGFLGSDDATYAAGAEGWLSQFPFVGAHGSLRETISVPMALSFLALGKTEFAMALPSLLHAMVLIGMAVDATARRLGPAAGLGAGILLATTPILPVQASTASIDVIEALFLFGSLALFHRATSEGATPARLLGAGALAGLAFLTRETAVFLLLLYGLLFLAGYGMERRKYWVMAAGFLAVWGAEVAYFWLAAGDPLYRINIALHHDSSIDRLRDDAGNVLVHPLVDPFLVVLVNQEFGLLFWAAVPATLWLLRHPGLSGEARRLAGLVAAFSGLWFLCVAAAVTLLPLNPRYFMVSAIGAAGLVGAALGLMWSQERTRLSAPALAAILLPAALMGIYLDNRHFMFGEKVLVELAATLPEPLLTDPVTLHRAEKLLQWDGTRERVSDAPPARGRLYLHNPARTIGPSLFLPADRVAAYQPGEAWPEVERREPEPKLAGRLLKALGLEAMVPGPLWRALYQGHPGVVLYRVPQSPNE